MELPHLGSSKKSDASGKKKWRLVIDYRKVNEKTIDDRYPIPNITDTFDKLGKSNLFTTLDLLSGFWQLEIHPNDVEKTAFNVENGHYEFLKMPFGLKNAPATFQRVMDHVLRDHIGKICVLYLDDILVYSTSPQEHAENLEKVLKALGKFNLKKSMESKTFARTSARRYRIVDAEER
jgi:Reverse transcriptase (RNA-dependent DNA polymerase)